MSRLLALGAAAPLAFSAIGGMSATVDPDDQAAAAAAVAVFNERLTDAGWTSHGPLTQSAAPEEGDESGSERVSAGSSCTSTTPTGTSTARQRGRSPTTSSSSADGAESVDATGDTGYAGAVVLTAAESAVGVLDTFVEQLGAEETAVCISQLQSFASTSDDESSVETTVTNDADLGVGERSARLDFSVAMTFEGNELTSSATFAAARVDRSLVVVAIGGSGSAGLSLDPVAELAAIVATFG